EGWGEGSGTMPLAGPHPSPLPRERGRRRDAAADPTRKHLDGAPLPRLPTLRVCALASARLNSESELDALRQALLEAAGPRPVAGEAALPANARHERALAEARDAVTSASRSPHIDARAAALSAAV